MASHDVVGQRNLMSQEGTAGIPPHWIFVFLDVDSNGKSELSVYDLAEWHHLEVLYFRVERSLAENAM